MKRFAVFVVVALSLTASPRLYFLRILATAFA